MPTASTLTVRQQRALAEMGIDVWIRRTRVDVQASIPAQVAESLRATTPARQQDGSGTESTGSDAAPSIQLECFAAPGVVLVGAFASATDRRFARDILVSIAGIGATVTHTDFRWPQTQTGDTSLAAARGAYLGFLRGQTDRADARCLLLLGNAAALDCSFTSTVCSVLRFEGAAVLRGDAPGKKALWLTISHLARG